MQELDDQKNVAQQAAGRQRIPEPPGDETLAGSSPPGSASVDPVEHAELFQRIVAQDSQALAEFYDRTAALLFTISFRILGDSGEAEEVIQDVFVQIWNKASTFDRALGTPLHWTVRIVRNRSIDRLRSRRRNSQMLDELQNLTLSETAPNFPATRPALAEVELATVRKMVRSLPSDQRQVLELAFFSCQTHAEIAQVTGEPLGTIKARIRRAMVRLRDTLQAYA